REDLLLADRELQATLLGVRDRILARVDVPLTPRCDHLEVRSKRCEGQLEADLVVALAGASVCERVGARRECALRLPASDDRPRHCGAKQILARVDRAGTQRREDRVAHELLTQILDDERLRTLLERTLLESRKLLAGADVRG